jgi:hypothetical protein
MAGLGAKYLVQHDPGTGRWNVYRGGKPTGAFARDQHTAIGAAARDASLEARESDLKVTVWLRDGKRARKVWPE